MTRTKCLWALAVLLAAGCDVDVDVNGADGAPVVPGVPGDGGATSGPTDAAVPALDASVAGDAGSTREDASAPNDASVAAPDARAPDLSALDPSAPPVLPPVTAVDADGPFATAVDMNVGPGGAGWVVRPEPLGSRERRHPIFVWGPGAGTGPSNYRDHLTRIASHGFVVYSEVSTGDGKEMLAALDWLAAEQARAGGPYAQKLDLTRIALGGHSRGSVSTFAAAADPRVRTTIHVAGGSFDGNGPKNLRHPAAMFLGEADTLATPNGERDYTNSTVPVFLTVMAGVDHIYAAREALAPTVAWLRWQLADESARSAMFLADACAFCTGKFVSKHKNF